MQFFNVTTLQKELYGFAREHLMDDDEVRASELCTRLPERDHDSCLCQSPSKAESSLKKQKGHSRNQLLWGF